MHKVIDGYSHILYNVKKGPSILILLFILLPSRQQQKKNGSNFIEFSVLEVIQVTNNQNLGYWIIVRVAIIIYYMEANILFGVTNIEQLDIMSMNAFFNSFYNAFLEMLLVY